ncbi:MAG: SAM-dependent methyltransferase, partial [Nocardiopsaceae bacterium]|nr:SAM-dependent methyltransferase [Nocardiopsaceae bacterium]
KPASAAQRPASGKGPALDTSIAHQARIYDYLLGGKDNFAADRQAGEAMVAAYPDTVAALRANRQFLRRVMRYLAGDAGIRQFLDIGTGIPTEPNVHQVVQEIAPQCRVVYVDYDPVVLSHARALLISTPAGVTDYIDADLRNTDAILEQAAGILDFSQPVAVSVLMTLHAIADDDDPHGTISEIMNALPAGSHLALTHPAADIEADKMADLTRRVNKLSFQQYTFRDRAEFARFFAGMDLVEPGIVPVEQWRPAIATPRIVPVWTAVGRKP